jgi:rod shape-determining protein MreD
MRLTGVIVSIALSLFAQALLARYTAGKLWVPDLVLVGVLYSGLRWGPVAGMLAGTVGGLSQDLMSGGPIIGVGGLTKTLIGFAVGAIGAQFVLVRPQARLVITALATVLHRLMMLGLYAAIDRPSGIPWKDILIQTAITAACALVAFQLTEAVPGALERGRANRRATLNRRKW